ncbi:unnamed protein product, partial [marine sediment metagenome]
MKNKQKLTAIMIISLFLVSMNYFNPENPLRELSEENQINEQIDEQLNDSKLIENSIIEPPIRFIIDYNQIYPGETVKTAIEFTKNTFNPDETRITCNEPNDVVDETWHNYGYLYEDDGNFFEISYEWGTPDDYQDFVIDLRIYCGSSGVLSWRDMRAYAANTGAAQTADADGDLTVTSSILDNEGYLHLSLNVRGTDTQAFLYFSYIDSTGYHTLESESATGTIGDTRILLLEIDMLYFQRDTIINNIRSEIRYTSPMTKTISTDIPSIPHAKEIRVYTDFDYSSKSHSS